jgi:hypothetical protein
VANSLTPGLVAPATTLFPPYDSQPPASGPYTVAFGSVSAGTTTNQQTVIQNVTSGDAIVVAANSNNAATAPVSVTDSQNNSYILASLDVNRAPNDAIFVALNCNPMVAGVDTITVTYAGTATVKSMIARGCSGYAGIDQIANPADGSASTTASNSLTALGTVSDWVVGSLSVNIAGGFPLSWTGLSQSAIAGPGPYLITADSVLSSSAPLSVTATFGQNAVWTLLLVALSPVPLINQQTPLLVPPGLPLLNSVSLVVPYSSQTSAAPVNIAGVTANVNVSGQADNSIAIYSAPSVQFPQAPALPAPLNFIPAFIGLRPQQQNVLPLVPVPGSTANVSVNAQFSDSTPAIYQINNPQQPFSPQLPPSLEFNTSSFALRQQYSTATPDVFVPGSSANVNVAAPSGTVTELIDGSGQIANVSAVAPAGSIAIYSAPSIQYPQAPALPAPLNFIPAFIGLRQQYSIAPLVQVLGATANVNVSAVSGAGVVIYPYGLQQPFSVQLPPSLQFNPASYVLRQQYSTAGPDIFVPGTTANVNVAAPAGSLLVTQVQNQPFPFLPLLPPSLQFNPAYINLRVPYDTAGIAPAVGNINVNGVTANVNVTAQFADIGLVITELVTPQFPFSPLLPPQLEFNPAFKTLRQQYPTALPDVFVPGTAANVSVSGQADNSVTESVLGTVANVNVTAPAGSISITTSIPPQFPFSPVLPNAVRFISSFTGLRVQYNTVAPIVALFGVTGQVNVTAPAGQINIVVGGADADNSVVAQAGNILVSVSGAASAVNTSAPNGTVDKTLTGITATVNVSAIPGTLPVFGSPGTVSVTAGSGSVVQVSVAGVPATVNVVTAGGSVTLEPDGTWWRVYPAYRTYPVW